MLNSTLQEWPEEVYPAYANGPGYVISSDIADFIMSEFIKQNLRVKSYTLLLERLSSMLKYHQNKNMLPFTTYYYGFEVAVYYVFLIKLFVVLPYFWSIIG